MPRDGVGTPRAARAQDGAGPALVGSAPARTEAEVPPSGDKVSFAEVVAAALDPQTAPAPSRVALCLYAAPAGPCGDLWRSDAAGACMLASYGRTLPASEVWVAAAGPRGLRCPPTCLTEESMSHLTALLSAPAVEKVCFNAQEVLAVPAAVHAAAAQTSALASGFAPCHVHDLRTMLWMLAGGDAAPACLEEALLGREVSLQTPDDAVPSDLLGAEGGALAAAGERPRKRAKGSATCGRAAATARCYLPEMLALHAKLKAELQAQRLAACYVKLEVPVAWVLTCMHVDGFDLDVGLLQESAEEMQERLGVLEEQARELTKEFTEAFNIQSGDDLRKVLFDDLQLQRRVDPNVLQLTKKKGVYSVDQQTLQSLAPHHALPGLVLQYRAVAKIYSTYIQNLSAHAKRAPHGAARTAVHPVFIQEGTETGRLSCSRPNLQNQPRANADAADGAGYAGAVRRAFTPRAGEVLVALDYSQIEVRVLAHMSQDPELTRILREGRDLHAAIAAKVFHKPVDAVTPAERQVGKKVVFGTLYGQGPRALAAGLGIEFSQACAFLNEFKRGFPRVQTWAEGVLAACRRSKEVRTFANRLRALPHISSTNGFERSYAERQAVNTVIQGTAADVIKMAMVASIPLAREHRLTLLCQVHDEMVFSAPAGGVAAAVPALKHAMENAIMLSVPLVVTAETGLSWGAMQPWEP
eukprot:TRINITY_DN20745_c0_g1_i1.p1 TRINITY_DN20745_c0_g1~~TRINITY_DN20745_c0_g1_i1.p1  ORF type:complete len:785 (+),score=211.95 TRINITY_DN20745_c0_g1_i1:262-2355(+)